MKGHTLRTISFTHYPILSHKEQCYSPNIKNKKKKVCEKKTKANMVEGIPKRWKVLSGQNKWKGLLDPLDPDLRRYIIHYGEMSQVGYDAFNWDRKSRYAGDCYYSKNRLLARTGFLKANPFRYHTPTMFHL